MTRPDYLLIGNVTQDILPDGNYTVGGTVTYAGCTAQKLGARVAVVTAAAADFEVPPDMAGLAWHFKPSPHTLTFRNVYTPEGRRQYVGPIAARLQAADVPARFRDAPLVHLAPLARELDENIVDAFPRAKILATVQGWLRRWDEDGRVHQRPWPGAARLLPALHSLVFSEEDVGGDWDLIRRWAVQTPTLVVTQGSRGCTVFHRGECRQVPPRPAREVEPTGAGDIFAAAFFVRYHQTGDPWAAACFANVVASFSVEGQGLSSVPSRVEVEAALEVGLGATEMSLEAGC
ncbi:MAG: PfkB family carbohydrate kinase [Anaerolineae bacterium]